MAWYKCEVGPLDGMQRLSRAFYCIRVRESRRLHYVPDSVTCCAFSFFLVQSVMLFLVQSVML